MREYSVLEHERFAFGNVIEHARLEYVYAGVDSIAGHLFGLRLLEEPADASVFFSFNQTILGGVRHWREHDGRRSLTLAMEANHFVHVDVGQHIAVEHHRRFAYQTRGIAIGAGGPERRRFH